MIIAFVIAFVCTMFTLPVIIKVAKIKNLLDVPDGVRKIHSRSVPLLGGVSIYGAVLIGFGISYGLNTTVLSPETLAFLISALTIMFFIGLKDDIVGLSPLKKLISQVIAAFILVVLADVRIPSMYGIFGIQELPLLVSYAFSIFAFIVILNSVNLVDGLDGLASGVSFIASVFMAFWFFHFDNLALTLLSCTLSGSLLAFLLFNFSPARIFMGDSGSLSVGLILAFLAISLLNSGNAPENIPAILQHVSRPVAAMSFLAYPLIDTLRAFFNRAIKGKSPFTADKNHLHHALMAKGYGHKKSVFIIYGVSVICSLTGIFSGYFGPTVSLASSVAVGFICVGVILKVLPNAR
jgi:UDP-N-acetylmuramyl pentapeptide phosphotransferase/UDP-N-acetylglucosamine-1-phosphate transferase